MNETACNLAAAATEWLKTAGVAYGFRILGALAILIIGAVAIKIFSGVLMKILEKSKIGSQSLVAKFIASVSVKVAWAFLAVIVLGKLGVDVGPLIAGLGVTGFVIGFAFQESLGSLAAGLMIAINKPFKVGDYVTVAGLEGSITALDMMAVTLATPDNKKITIPNKQAWGGPIVNYSALARRRVDLRHDFPGRKRRTRREDDLVDLRRARSARARQDQHARKQRVRAARGGGGNGFGARRRRRLRHRQQIRALQAQ